MYLPYKAVRFDRAIYIRLAIVSLISSKTPMAWQRSTPLYIIKPMYSMKATN